MGVVGSQGGAVESEGSRTRCPPAGGWQVPTGEDRGLSSCHAALPFAQMWGAGSRSGVCPTGWEIPNQPRHSEQGSFWTDGQARCPTAHPTAAPAAKAREETCVPTEEVSGGQQLDSASRSLPVLGYHLKR